MIEPQSPTKNEKNLRFKKMKEMKQALLNIRQRKSAMPQVEQPLIVRSFNELTLIKKNEIKIKQTKESIESKKKYIEKLNKDILVYKEKYDSKNESFKQRTHLLKLLSSKLELQYQKTKQVFLDVEVNRTILTGLRKLSYLRLSQILFNDKAKNVFYAIQSQMQGNQNNLMMSQGKSDQEMGICLGYLGLLITIVGYICGARLWFDFTFRGSKSTLRLNDGTYVILRPREGRFTEGQNVMIEQLYQIMNHDMGVKFPKVNNLYQMCEELSKIMMC